MKGKENLQQQIKNSPFDRLVWEGCLLHCSKCGASILPWPVNMTWPEYFYDHKRVAPIVEHHITKHKQICLHWKEGNTIQTELPSGQRVTLRAFGNHESVEKTEHRLEDPPPFKLGMWCINTASGHLWQLETARDLEVVTEGWINGKRNVKPYV